MLVGVPQVQICEWSAASKVISLGVLLSFNLSDWARQLSLRILSSASLDRGAVLGLGPGARVAQTRLLDLWFRAASLYTDWGRPTT